MNYVKPDVQTIGIGLQASMGSMLLACGAKGKRFVLPNSRIMIHQPSSGTQGKVTDQEITLRESVYIKKRLIEILRSGRGRALNRSRRTWTRDSG